MILRKYTLWKRIFDISFSLSLIVSLFPLGVLIILVALWETRAFPLFVQTRSLSLEGKRFRIFKIRTIRKAAKRVSFYGKGSKVGTNIFSKQRFEPFVPPFCCWLRRTGLDELPQLVNIVKGEMSFIGPRPLMIEDLEAMKRESLNLYVARVSLRSKPGLSGLWQLFGNRKEGVENLLYFDLLYENSCSFGLDVVLLAKTISILLFAGHSDSIVRSNSRLKFFAEGGSAQRVESSTSGEGGKQLVRKLVLVK